MKKNFITTFQCLLAAFCLLGSVTSASAQVPAAPCVLTCPSNITINLDPGACDQIVNYAVTTTGTCVIGGSLTGFQGAFAPSAINYYQYDAGIFTNPPTPFTDGYAIDFNNPANTTLTLRSADFGFSPGPNLFFFNGVEWTNNTTAPQNISFNWNYSTNDGPFWDRPVYLIGNAANNFANNNFGNQIGNWTNFTGFNVNGAFVQNGVVNITLQPGQRLALAAYTQDAGGGPATIVISNFAVSSIVPAVAVQTSGIPSGGTFPRGVTQNCFSILANNAQGVPTTQSCCFTVTVLEFPNAVTTLACNDLIFFSVDENCQGVVGADDVLEGGPYGCYDDYIVELDRTAPFGNGPWTPAVVGPADIGKTYQVRVTDPTTGNKCWGNIKFEDKLPPVLVCRDIVLPCNGNPNVFPFNQPAPPITGPQSQIQNVNNPIGEAGAPIPDVQNYTFNYGYLPTGTPVLDVNVRIKLTGHTWLPDLDIDVISPNGTVADVFTLGGCVGAEFPIDVLFDDEGTGNLTLCAQLDVDGAPTQSVVTPGVSGPTVLSVFDGQNASGVWTVRISDNVGGDDGVVEIVGLQVTVNLPQIVPADACSAINLTFIDSELPGSCASGFSRTIVRKYTATDASGNSTTCIQRIFFEVPTFDDLTLPPDYDGIDAPFFLCTDNAYPTPEYIESLGLQGFPYIFGLPEGCTINYDYEDLVIEVCDGTYKIRRQFTIIDWCLGISFEHNQIIKVVDDEGPVIACPANLTVSVDQNSCCATTNLPDVIVTDNCSQINNISGMIVQISPFTGDTIAMVPIGGILTSYPGNNLWEPDTLAAFGFTPCLPIGTHTVTYVAEDDCGNTSSCTFRITVRDYVEPVASCDETTVVAIGGDDPFDCYGPAGPFGSPAALDACTGAGVTLVPAANFNDGSYDNCGDVFFTVRRMSPYSDCILALNPTNGHPDCADIFPDFPSEFERAISEDDTIKFYCCEVGTIQTIILRVYQIDFDGNFSIGPDGSPIYNECMIQVEVQDKIKPTCVPPAHVTVSCTNFDPSLWAYGKPVVADNCCLDTTKVFQDQCGLTQTVNYNLFDTVCNRGTITRTFRAFDCHGFSSSCTQRIVVNYVQDYFVRFPDDVIITVCDGTGNYGEPTFFGEDCELLGTSFEDQIFTVVPDACFKIERTWTIINWCTYNPNLPCIEVPNPSPNAIVNHPTNLPGVVVSACGTVGPWAPTVRRINSTDPTTTNYCTFYDANANCYKYKQIIKVIDNKAPIIANCPASPVTFCDFTPNDPFLWNEAYYFDQVTGSHDLCEGPTDLTITASDACSLQNVDIRYLLFLDLNGDGVMETVINSSNLPPTNTVFFGNALNANYTGGTAYNFDERPVPFNQKYRFALQTTVSGVNKTGAVRWNTIQSPNTYVVPELPYGTHKIKWFVGDGCGNEATCEYTFIVKDCKAPTVVCLNGLSVNIMPTQMIQLWATDFLQYAEDNCTPVGQLKFGIRRSGTGTGFPFDGNGQPITNVIFTCADLGTQPVELWVIDAAGNADFCETYVIVQDNNGNCGPGVNATVAGALKTENTAGLEEGSVEVAGSNPATPPFSMFDLSDQNGAYQFSNAIPMASNLTITPTKDNNPLNGVSTYDLVLISRHILGLEPLGSPYKMIAADANKSGSITTFDIVELRKLILGIYQELPNNTSWRFVDKSFSFPNANNPFQTVFPENKTVANIQASQMNDDFVAVKIGDVNQNAIANAQQAAEDRTTGTLLIDVEDRQVQAGESFEVNFKTAEAAQGYQFTLNLSGLTVTEIAGGAKVGPENFGVFTNALTASVDGAENFTVRFTATKAGRLSEMLNVSSQITKSEAYTLSGERQEVALRFNNGGVSTISGVGFELYQNQPNPFVGKTFIGFHLPAATMATLTVYDESGRVIFTQKGDYAKGYNTITVERALLNTAGMLYYKLETATDMATKKMIQTK